MQMAMDRIKLAKTDEKPLVEDLEEEDDGKPIRVEYEDETLLYHLERNLKDKSVVAEPRTAEHKFSLVWLHGIGNDGFNAFK